MTKLSIVFSFFLLVAVTSAYHIQKQTNTPHDDNNTFHGENDIGNGKYENSNEHEILELKKVNKDEGKHSKKESETICEDCEKDLKYPETAKETKKGFSKEKETVGKNNNEKVEGNSEKKNGKDESRGVESYEIPRKEVKQVKNLDSNGDNKKEEKQDSYLEEESGSKGKSDSKKYKGVTNTNKEKNAETDSQKGGNSKEKEFEENTFACKGNEMDYNEDSKKDKPTENETKNHQITGFQNDVQTQNINLKTPSEHTNGRDNAFAAFERDSIEDEKMTFTFGGSYGDRSEFEKSFGFEAPPPKLDYDQKHGYDCLVH